MFKKVILLSGPVAVGKTKLAQGLVEIYGFCIFNTSEIIRKRVGGVLGQDRRILQSEGELLDKNTKGRWVVEELDKLSGYLEKDTKIIVDSIRIRGQLESIHEVYRKYVVHIHLTASIKTLEQRFNQRTTQGKELDISYGELIRNPTEKQVEDLAKFSDIFINTDGRNIQEVLALVSEQLLLPFTSENE